MSADPVAMIVARLEAGGFDPRPTGPDTYESRCPVHNGSRHNLSIRRGDDGRALAHCHHQGPGGRCDHRALVAALDLTEADLFPGDWGEAKAKRGGERKAKTYSHPRDAAEAIAYRLGCSSANV